MKKTPLSDSSPRYKWTLQEHVGHRSESLPHFDKQKLHWCTPSESCSGPSRMQHLTIFLQKGFKSAPNKQSPKTGRDESRMHHEYPECGKTKTINNPQYCHFLGGSRKDAINNGHHWTAEKHEEHIDCTPLQRIYWRATISKYLHIHDVTRYFYVIYVYTLW